MAMPPAYSSPTSRGGGGDFPQGFGVGNGRSGPMSPIKIRPQEDGFARHDSPMGQRHDSPSGLRGQQQQQQQQAGHYQPVTHHMQHPPPPPYGSAPPPPYEGMMHHSPMGMPPPPSYEETLAIQTNQQVGSRHDSPNLRTRASPGRGDVTTPVAGDQPPAYNTRYRHDPYSPEGSRVVSPNRRDLPASPTRQQQQNQ